MSRNLMAVMAALVAVSPLAADHELPRWVSLFNGKDVDNWTYAKPERKGAWKVVDGAMTQVDKVDFCTKDEFEDFLLEVEFKSLPDGHGNSGVYLRGVYEVQIYNSTDKVKAVKDLRPHHGGGIYGKAPPMANPHKKQGEWNKYTILMHGQKITVWINGVLVQDSVEVSGKTGGAMNVSRSPKREGKKLEGKSGPIMLQGDHDLMWFRNLKLLTLPEGWKPLWNGKDLSEFTMSNKGQNKGLEKKKSEYWGVTKENSFVNLKHGHKGGKDIWTKGAYGNFLVHYEYRSNPDIEGGNSGFYLRDQWEIQIFGQQALGKKGLHRDGALYSTKAPDILARRGPNDWNVMDVKLIGNKVWVWQNGALIHDGVELTKRTDNKQPTEVFSKAPFKLQGDHGQVWFRNLFIRELPGKTKASL